MFEPGTTLAGKFLIERVLGKGGMGVVLAARHLGLDQRRLQNSSCRNFKVDLTP